MPHVPSMDEVRERLQHAPDIYVSPGDRYECPCGCLKVEAPAHVLGNFSVVHWCVGCGRQVEVAA